jgi:hypothetical protein
MKVSRDDAEKRYWKQTTMREISVTVVVKTHEWIKHCVPTKEYSYLLLEIHVAQMSPYNTLQTARLFVVFKKAMQ